MISKSLGSKTDHNPDIEEMGYRRGDRFILCTDGVWGSMPHKKLLKFFAAKGQTANVVCSILQRFVFGPVGVPFVVTVVALVMLIWLYTRRGGIKTLVWTDTFQTFCMMAALLIIIVEVIGKLDMSVGDAVWAVVADSHSRIFVFDDWVSTQNFFKQFLSGVFIVVVMTGLDQHMMQKNLTCKTLRDAQKDMCVGGFFFVPVNLLFLSLGVLLLLLAGKEGLAVPADSDELLPMFAA